MAPKRLIAGNWKMNLNHLEAIALVQQVAFSLPDRFYDLVDVSVIPPFTDIRSVQSVIEGDRLRLTFGAQDVSMHDSGAYTGEVSGAMLAKLGCTYVVVGHSERRAMHGETDEIVLNKAKAALRHGLTPIVCVGEALSIRQSGEHVAYCVASLKGSLAGLKADEIAKVVIAYEPVWAIGTGEVATPEDAQEVCAAIRSTLVELAGAEVAGGVRVLYGGSVNSANVADLVAQPDVDGGLVGGASLKGDEFAKLCAAAATAEVAG
ncbi:MAG: triose-phosphate isomerase [Nocardiaceae bacterium]|nr:triose-phosphate isomerase [Nocardiaceae bacterium]